MTRLSHAYVDSSLNPRLDQDREVTSNAAWDVHWQRHLEHLKRCLENEFGSTHRSCHLCRHLKTPTIMSLLRLLFASTLLALTATSLRALRDTYRWYTREPYNFYKSKNYYHWTSRYSGWNERATELPQTTSISESDLVCAAGVQGMGGHSFEAAFFETGIVVRGDGKILQLADEDAAGFETLATNVRELPQIHKRDHFAIDHDSSCTSLHNIYLTNPNHEATVHKLNTGGSTEILEVFGPRDGPAELRRFDYGVNIYVDGFYKHYRRMDDGEDLPQCLWELLGLLEETNNGNSNSDGIVSDDREHGPRSDLLRRMRKWEGMKGIVANPFDDRRR